MMFRVVILVSALAALASTSVCNFNSNPCGVEGSECYDVDSERNRCVCPTGYMEVFATNTARTCQDVDECRFTKMACGDNANCVNSEGSFTCSCYKKFYWDGYQCQRKGQNKECSQEFPEFLVRPQETVKLELGDELRLSCVATGSPAPNIYWTKGPKRVRMGPTSRESSTFIIPNVTKADIDLYECVVEDCCSGRTIRSRVDVSVPSMPCISDTGLQMFAMVWEYKTWDEAKDFCEERGLKLAVVRNEEQRKTIRQDAWRCFLRDPNGKKFGNQYWLWLGASDTDMEGKFREVDGRDADDGNWMVGTPDNWSKLSEEGQDHVAMHRLTGRWDDSYGFHRRPFACQCKDA